MTGDIISGLLVLRGNRTEMLAKALFERARSSPLGNLDDQYQVYRSEWLSAWLSGNDDVSPAGACVTRELHAARAARAPRVAQQTAAQDAK